MRTPYTIGIVYDHWTPQVQTQVIKDLIAIMNQPNARDLRVYCESTDPALDMTIGSVGAQRAPLKALATLWIVYQTGNEVLEVPEHAEEIIERDLRIGVADPDILDTDEKSGFYLAPQGRNIAPTLDINRPMPAHQPGGTDPMVIWLWG